MNTTPATIDRKADAAALAALVAPKLATVTGSSWSVVDSRPEFQGVHLVREEDGARLFVRPAMTSAERGRLVVTTDEPADVDQHNRESQSDARVYVTEERATFAGDRDPAAIAREIARRLLPGLEAATADARERMGKETAYRTATERGAVDLAAVIPGAQVMRERGKVTGDVWMPGAHGTAQVRGGRVTFRNLGSVSVDQARRIAAILAERTD